MSMDKDLEKALKVCAHHLDKLEADWAVAGATAMAAYGYVRHTKDVDLFVGDDVRTDLLEHLKTAGLNVKPQMAPYHYAIRVSATDRERRIELLFPALGPESLGIMAARRHAVAGMNLPVIPLEHIVAAKLIIDPAIDRDRYDKDHRDLNELRARGLVDVKRVESVLEDLSDTQAIERLHTLMAQARQHDTANQLTGRTQKVRTRPQR